MEAEKDAEAEILLYRTREEGYAFNSSAERALQDLRARREKRLRELRWFGEPMPDFRDRQSRGPERRRQGLAAQGHSGCRIVSRRPCALAHFPVGCFVYSVPIGST